MCTHVDNLKQLIVKSRVHALEVNSCKAQYILAVVSTNCYKVYTFSFNRQLSFGNLHM